MRGQTGIVLRILFVEFFRELLVGVGLDAEGLLDREDFEEEGELVAIVGCDVRGEEGLVLGDEVEEGSACGYIFGRV